MGGKGRKGEGEEKEEMRKGREKGRGRERGKLRHGFRGMDAPAHRGLYNNFGKTINAWWAGGFA